MGENKTSALAQTELILLRLRQKLMIIEEKHKPTIENLANETVNAISKNYSENEKNDLSRKLLHENFQSFSALRVEMPSLFKESRKIMEDSLNGATVRVLEGEDITQITCAQSIELLKEYSFLFGFLSQLTIFANVYKEKIPDGKFQFYFLCFLIQKTKCEQQKTFQMSHDLLPKAARESPKITDVILTFDPLLGYVTDNGIPDSYSEFLKTLKKTSDEWFNMGRYFGLRRYRSIKESMHTYDAVV